MIILMFGELKLLTGADLKPGKNEYQLEVSTSLVGSAGPGLETLMRISRRDAKSYAIKV